MAGTDTDRLERQQVAVPFMPEAPVIQSSAETVSDGSSFFADLLNEKKYTTNKPAAVEASSGEVDYLPHCESQIRPGFATIEGKYKVDNPRNRFFSEVTRQHGLTELPILNDKVRGRIALTMSKCIEQGEGFALILCDTDQLKRLNDVAGRAIGDIGIKANAAETIHQLAEGGFGDDMYVFAAGESPDEVIVFIRNLDPVKNEELKKIVKTRNETKHEVHGIPVKRTDGTTSLKDATFSGSAGMVTSLDEVAAREVFSFRTLIEKRKANSQPVTPAYVLFDLLREEADSLAHEVKEKHERDTFPDIAEFKDLIPEEARGALIAEYSGKRISPALFNAIIALAMIRGMSDSEKMTPVDKAAEIVRLEEAIRHFTEE